MIGEGAAPLKEGLFKNQNFPRRESRLGLAQGRARDLLVLEGESELLEQSVAFFVGVSRGNEGDVHTHEFGDVVDVDFGEDDLLGDAEGIVTAAVEFTFDTLEVADTGQSYANEAFEELVHFVATQSYAYTDRHFLTNLEVGDVLLREGLYGLLTGDSCKLVD
jgi:hypothetical protein